MTALDRYDRLESSGIWRSDPDAEPRDVTVALGNATLIVTDFNERPLAHWSLPALERLNPGQMPALYTPDPGAEELLEIDEELMVEAIEKVHRAVLRRRPQPGRLRTATLLGAAGIVIAAGVFILPGALRMQAVKVVPEVQRSAIGTELLGELAAIAGKECRAAGTGPTLRRLKKRLTGEDGGRIAVLSGDTPAAMHLPGDILVVNARAVEQYDGPDVLAGLLITEDQRARRRDPLDRLLEKSGLFATVRLLTTGRISRETLRDYAQSLVTAQPTFPREPEKLAAAFAQAEVAATPYAMTLDPSGESTLPLIEADALLRQDAAPLMSDADWVRLQEICAS